VDVMGSSAARISSGGVVASMGPTPEEPAIVTCGGAEFASFGSNSR